MIKVPGHFKFFAIIISSLRFFSDSLVSSLRVRRYFSVRWNFSTINVPGHFSKSDGTFSPIKCPVIYESDGLFIINTSFE